MKGQVFERLTVVGEVVKKPRKNGYYHSYWPCQCSCGSPIKLVEEQALKSGRTRSCGCLNKESIEKKKLKDLEGKVFRNFRVIGIKEIRKMNGRNHNFLECECLLCGNLCIVKQATVVRGEQESCGCSRHRPRPQTEKHGGAKTKLYKCYIRMIRRCYDKNLERYPRYGGRGIAVEPEWLGDNGFTNFREWSLKQEPNIEQLLGKKGLQLNKIENDSNYSPSNCNFIPDLDQYKNKKNTIWVEIDGQKMSLLEAVEKFHKFDMDLKDVKRLVRDRYVRYKWDLWDALTIPPDSSQSYKRIKEGFLNLNLEH